MNDSVTIVECPRDAWQGLATRIPAEAKAQYLRKLIDAGFSHIDAVSFVSPSSVPQMADSERVLQYLDPTALVEIIGIVVNQKGAERAINTGKVQTLGFPYSISRTFLKRNQHQTPAESLQTLEQIASLAYNAGLGLVAYISMAFGNPYGESWSIEQVLEACHMLIESGVRQISLADTVGLATSAQVSEMLSALLPKARTVEVGVHLHAIRGEAAVKIRAAYQAGCRRFDAAIGGLGGCPFAQDALVGNIPTEVMLQVLGDLGAKLPPITIDRELIDANAQISREYGVSALHSETEVAGVKR